MRLAKKVAAIALAAAMSVSMLTACGGDGSSTGGNNGNSGSSGSGPSSSSSSSSTSSGASSSSDSSSASSSSSSSSDSGITGEGEPIEYAKSRTAKFFKKLGDNYTIDAKVTDESEYGTEVANTLVSTNGNRVYECIKSTGKDTQIVLSDQAQQKSWIVIPTTKELYPGVAPGENGYCIALTYKDDPSDDDSIDEVEPVTGIRFTKETRGAYYVEIQTVEQKNEKDVTSYWYEGNSSVPKYVYTESYENDQKMNSYRMDFNSIEFKARAEYMDFESILSKCTDITELMQQGEIEF